MRKDRGLVILAAAAPLAALPVGTLAGLGGWLRELSLSGPGGNAGAWAIVLGLTALPALGLLWRGRRRADWLLLLAAGEILAGLFYLVNPTLLTAEYGAGNVIALAAAGCVGATLLAWAAMRGLGGVLASERPGRTMERLLRWSGWAWAWLAALAQGAGLWQEIRRTAEGNSALDTGALMPTYLTLGVLAVMDLVPALLCCQILRWGGRLALGLEEDPFGGETVALAEGLSRRCGRVAAVSVLVCGGGNLLQMLLFPVLRTTRFTLSFPAATVLLAAALGLLCQYLRRAKAVNDDSQTII